MNKFNDIRDKIKKLLLDCPKSSERQDCPLKDIRKVSIEEGVKIISKMPDELLLETDSHHAKCFHNLIK